MNYEQSVKANLEHLGTPMHQWQAVPVKGMVQTEDNSKKVSMPEFDFPQGYASAPSLYKNNGAGDVCCELCAHPIKNVYWIQNDTKKWTMIVGSECVTRFGEGKSGEQLSKEVVWEQNRELMGKAIQLKKALFDKYMRRADRGYGRYEYVWNYGLAHKDNADLKDYTELRKMVQDRVAYPVPGWKNIEPDSNGVVSRWVKKNGEKVNAWLEKYNGLMNS